MAELIRTNDVALISVVEAVLKEADLPYFVADRNSSVIDGSINFVQMRILVPDERAAEARQAITEAELGEWLES